MANGGDGTLLVDRLQMRIDQLRKAQTEIKAPNPDLQAAIEGLLEELDALRICFPFVYGAPPIIGARARSQAAKARGRKK